MSEQAFKNNVIIMRNGALGDFVLTLPVFQSVQDYYTNHTLYAIGNPTNCTLLTKSWNIIDTESRDWFGLYSDGILPSTVENLLKRTTLMLIYGAPSGSFFKNVKKILGKKALFFDPHPPINYSEHITNYLLSPLNNILKIPISNPSPIYDFPAKKAQKVDTIAHIGSSSPIKNWPLKNFVKWANALKKKGIKVNLILGPVEKEIGILESVDFPIIYPKNLQELVHSLMSAKLFVGNDSGPGHLAAALGTATLTLFGPTNPVVWAPNHPKNKVLLAPDKNMDSLSVDSVVCATLKRLNS